MSKTILYTSLLSLYLATNILGAREILQLDNISDTFNNNVGPAIQNIGGPLQETFSGTPNLIPSFQQAGPNFEQLAPGFTSIAPSFESAIPGADSANLPPIGSATQNAYAVNIEPGQQIVLGPNGKSEISGFEPDVAVPISSFLSGSTPLEDLEPEARDIIQDNFAPKVSDFAESSTPNAIAIKGFITPEISSQIPSLDSALQTPETQQIQQQSDQSPPPPPPPSPSGAQSQFHVFGSIAALIFFLLFLLF